MNKIRKRSDSSLDPKNSAIDNFLQKFAKRVEAAPPVLPPIGKRTFPGVQRSQPTPEEIEKRNRAIEERNRERGVDVSRNIPTQVHEWDLPLDSEQGKTQDPRQNYIPDAGDNWKVIFEKSSKDNESKQDKYLHQLGKKVGVDIGINDIKKDFGSLNSFLNTLFYPMYNLKKEERELSNNNEQSDKDEGNPYKYDLDIDATDFKEKIKEIRNKKIINNKEMFGNNAKYRRIIPLILSDIENSNIESYESSIEDFNSNVGLLRGKLDIFDKYSNIIGQDLKKLKENINFEDTFSGYKTIKLYESIIRDLKKNNINDSNVKNIENSVNDFKNKNYIYKTLDSLHYLEEMVFLFSNETNNEMQTFLDPPINEINKTINDIFNIIDGDDPEAREISELYIDDCKKNIENELKSFFEKSRLVNKSERSRAIKSYEKCMSFLDKNINSSNNDYLIKSQESTVNENEVDEFYNEETKGFNSPSNKDLDSIDKEVLEDNDYNSLFDEDLIKPSTEHREDPGVEYKENPDLLKNIMSSTFNRSDYKVCKRND